jgi:hypothetical protein
MSNGLACGEGRSRTEDLLNSDLSDDLVAVLSTELLGVRLTGRDDLGHGLVDGLEEAASGQYAYLSSCLTRDEDTPSPCPVRLSWRAPQVPSVARTVPDATSPPRNESSPTTWTLSQLQENPNVERERTFVETMRTPATLVAFMKDIYSAGGTQGWRQTRSAGTGRSGRADMS